MNLSNLWSLFNPLSVSLLGAYALYLFKGVFQAIYEFVMWRFLSSIAAYSKESAFKDLSDWLSDHRYLKTARHFSLRNLSYEADLQVSPGAGWHIFFHKKIPYFLYWHISQLDGSSGYTRHEEIKIFTLSLFRRQLRALASEAILDGGGSSNKDDDAKVTTYIYTDYWWKFSRKSARSLDTIFLADPEEIPRIQKDIESFNSNKEFYVRNGIPYHRGYFFHGSPGTGKSSLVMALAGYYNRPLYLINLGSVDGDDSLIKSFMRCPANAIILIEDIDAAIVAKDRGSSGKKDSDGDEEKKGISLSCLLNILDGAMAKEGHLLFLSSNHPEKLDPALLREGRIDYKVEFKDLPREVAETMISKSGLPDGKIADLKASLSGLNRPSQVQGMILKAL